MQVSCQDIKLLEGQIIADSSSVDGIHIVNLDLETGTTSDPSGNFTINARPGDTLFFSSIQFEHQRIVIDEASFRKKLRLRLIKKYNELDEVQLDDIRLSGILQDDIDKVPKSIYEKLGMPFPKPRRSSLELAVQSATGNGHVISLLNRLNGTTERLEKAEENNERARLVNKGFGLVGKSFFVDELKISENEIINLLFFCVDDEEYQAIVRTEDKLKLREYLPTKIDSFKELRELD